MCVRLRYDIEHATGRDGRGWCLPVSRAQSCAFLDGDMSRAWSRGGVDLRKVSPSYYAGWVRFLLRKRRRASRLVKCWCGVEQTRIIESRSDMVMEHGQLTVHMYDRVRLITLVGGTLFSPTFPDFHSSHRNFPVNGFEQSCMYTHSTMHTTSQRSQSRNSKFLRDTLTCCERFHRSNVQVPHPLGAAR